MQTSVSYTHLPMPEAVKKIIVKNVNEVEEVASQVDFVFSAVDMSKDEIKKIEEDYAKTETPVEMCIRDRFLLRLYVQEECIWHAFFKDRF